MRLWAAAGIAALAAGAAAAQDGTGRYALMADFEAGIWVVDALEGRVARCREGGARAPRVVDVAFGVAMARPRDGAGREPVCTAFVTIPAPAGARPRVIGATAADAGFPGIME